MFLECGAKKNHDACEKLGNPGRDWDGSFLYFRKSVKLSAPAEEAVGKWEYTWDARAYMEEGMIHANFLR